MTKILTDAMLGKLTRYLRMCGFDTAYVLDRGVEDDDTVLAIARQEGRVLLTRDTALAGRISPAILIHGKDINDQLRELRQAGFDVSLDEPTRCSLCNSSLNVAQEPSTPDYAPDPESMTVWKCSNCNQYYWRGSHWEDVKKHLASL